MIRIFIELSKDRWHQKKINLIEALLILIFFLIISFIILLQFNLAAVIVGLLSVPLIIIYPFMKRVTYWPQLILGIVFSWGILIVTTQFNNSLTVEFLLLYIGCIFWTLGYDTIYAYQDRTDDIKQGIKSTAVFFGENGRIFVTLCYFFVVIIFGYLGWNSSNSSLSIIIINHKTTFLQRYKRSLDLQHLVVVVIYMQYLNQDLY